MTSTLARNGIVFIGLLSLAAFGPGIVRWYRHRHDRVARYDPRFRVQHLSHLILFVHHLLVVVMMLIGFDPFPFVPDNLQLTGSAFRAVVLSGLTLFALGNALRIWAAYYMGESFDKSVLVKADHQLSTDGPYRLSRHPIYVGNLLAELGLGVALTSLPLVAFTLLVSAPVWNYRAEIEETMLTEHFGESYREYCRRVGRWLPW